VACAIVASGISTFAGYPVSLRTYREEQLLNATDPFNQLDSLKSRLQTIKHPISVPSLAVLVYREEGVRGFYRGLWIPLVTITFVRTLPLFPFAWHFFPLRSVADDVTRSGLFYHLFRNKGDFSRCPCSQPGHSSRYLIIGRTRVRPGSSGNPRMLTPSCRGALAGSAISFGSAPFELVKVWSSFHVHRIPNRSHDLRPVSASPRYADSRSDVSSSIQSLPPRDSIFPTLLALSKPSETS
jgi:hypothetical protein